MVTQPHTLCLRGVGLGVSHDLLVGDSSSVEAAILERRIHFWNPQNHQNHESQQNFREFLGGKELLNNIMW